jgi:hypothetical protein
MTKFKVWFVILFLILFPVMIQGQTFSFPDTMKTGFRISWNHWNPVGEPILFKLFTNGAIFKTVQDSLYTDALRATFPLAMNECWITASDSVGNESAPSPYFYMKMFPVTINPPDTGSGGGTPLIGKFVYTVDEVVGDGEKGWVVGNVSTLPHYRIAGGMVLWGQYADAIWALNWLAPKAGTINIKIRVRTPNNDPPTAVPAFSVGVVEHRKPFANGDKFTWLDMGEYPVVKGNNIFQYRALKELRTNFVTDSLKISYTDQDVTAPSAPGAVTSVIPLSK